MWIIATKYRLLLRMLPGGRRTQWKRSESTYSYSYSICLTSLIVSHPMPVSLPQEFHTVWSKTKMSGQGDAVKFRGLLELLLSCRPMDDKTCFLLIIWIVDDPWERTSWINVYDKSVSFSKDHLKGSDAGSAGEWPGLDAMQEFQSKLPCYWHPKFHISQIKAKPLYCQHLLWVIQIYSRLCILVRMVIT